jgi:hypothetical protein
MDGGASSNARRGSSPVPPCPGLLHNGAEGSSNARTVASSCLDALPLALARFDSLCTDIAATTGLLRGNGHNAAAYDLLKLLVNELLEISWMVTRDGLKVIEDDYFAAEVVPLLLGILKSVKQVDKLVIDHIQLNVKPILFDLFLFL